MKRESVKVFFSIAAAYAVLELLGITCPIRFLTGISCAGCGMSRAWFSVLRLDFAAAFSYHPLLFLPPLAVVVWLFRRRLPKRLLKLLGVGTLLLLLVVYVIRMLDPMDTVVTFSPRNGWFQRVVVDLFDV